MSRLYNEMPTAPRDGTEFLAMFGNYPSISFVVLKWSAEVGAFVTRAGRELGEPFGWKPLPTYLSA